MATVRQVELEEMFLGPIIGRGMNRIVHAYKLLPKDYVVKVEDTGNEFQNIMEWRLWDEVEGTEYDKWFAPCIAISPNGQLLLQARVKFPDKEKYPKKLPKFFTDLKYQNFGLYKNHWVACDYGYPIIFRNNRLDQLRKVKWWSDELAQA